MFAGSTKPDDETVYASCRTFSTSTLQRQSTKTMYKENIFLQNNSLKQSRPYHNVSQNPKLLRKKPITKYSCSSWSVKAQDFSQNTSLHGLRYVGDASLHTVER